MTCMTCYDSVVIPKRLGILESSPAPVNVYVYVRLRSQLPFTEPLEYCNLRDFPKKYMTRYRCIVASMTNFRKSKYDSFFEKGKVFSEKICFLKNVLLDIFLMPYLPLCIDILS